MSRFRSMATALVLGGTSTLAMADVLITFDVPQANYVPTPGVDQVIDDQFIPLGIVFRDADFPTLGAVGGDAGPGSEPVHLYSNDGSGNTDVIVDIDITFVDPLDSSTPAATTEFSAIVTDSVDTTFSAYDATGSFLGSASSTGTSLERVSLSGIGPISLVEIRTASDATAIDDIIYADIEIQRAIPTVSVSGLAILALLLLAAGSAMLRRRAG